MYFYIFFYPHIFSHIFSNKNFQFSSADTKHPLNIENYELKKIMLMIRDFL